MGVLKRIVVIDVSPEGDQPIILINPEVIEKSGEQTGYEGCLSVPGKTGIVTRANYCKVKALNENMEEIIVEGEELLARALQHEIAHLEGELYVSLVEGELLNNSGNSGFCRTDTCGIVRKPSRSGRCCHAAGSSERTKR